ncbi:MAG: ATP-grasp domain-containing protein [Magnetococcales bacterium]|nr:ATP-grasp domain-containing protein [Magnetococcales bacterium]
MISQDAVVDRIGKALHQLAASRVPQEARKILFLARIDALFISRVIQESLREPILSSGATLVATRGDYRQFDHLRQVLPKEKLGPHFHDAQSIGDCLRMLHRPGDVIVVVVTKPVAAAVIAPEGDDQTLLYQTASQAEGVEPASPPSVTEARPVFASPANERIIRALFENQRNDFSGSAYLRDVIFQSPSSGKMIKRSLTQRLLLHVAKKRGGSIRAVRAECNSTILPYRHGERSAIFHFSPDISVVCHAITPNKHLTKAFLESHDIPTPQGGAFEDPNAAKDYFLSRTVPQVVKPLNAARSDGVSVRIQNEAAFDRAWNKACQFGNKVIVEDFFSGDLVRVIVLAGRVITAVCRTPAYVVGDGVSTVAELIDTRNEARLLNPSTKEHPIRHTKLNQFKQDGGSLLDIPPAGQSVRLTSEPLVSNGGEIVSILEQLHPSILELSEKIARVIPGAGILGLDLLVADFSAAASRHNVCVLEVNSSPVLTTSLFPVAGPPASGFIDALFDFVDAGLYETARSRPPEEPFVRPARPCDFGEEGEESGMAACDTVTLLTQAARSRELSIETVDARVQIFLTPERRIGFFKGMPSSTRSLAYQASGNPAWIKRLLREGGVPTPEGRLFPIDALEEAWKFAEALRRPVMLRPTVISKAFGVSLPLVSRDHFSVAWKRMIDQGVNGVMVEEYCRGRLHGLLVIGDGVRAATQWTFDAEQTEGCAQDVSERVHPGFARIAVQVRKAIYDPTHAGLDLIAESLEIAPDAQFWTVIGATANPDLCRYQIPGAGRGRDVAGALLDALFPERSGETEA